MQIEKIIEFELREPGLPSHTCIPTIGYFYEKKKYLRQLRNL